MILCQSVCEMSQEGQSSKVIGAVCQHCNKLRPVPFSVSGRALCRIKLLPVTCFGLPVICFGGHVDVNC